VNAGHARTDESQGIHFPTFQEFDALYSQGGFELHVALEFESEAVYKATMTMDVPQLNQQLVDIIRHDETGFRDRTFDFLAGDPETVRVLASEDSLHVYRTPFAGGETTLQVQSLSGPIVDGTLVYWALGAWNTALPDSAHILTWRMTPAGAEQRSLIFVREKETDQCVWWKVTGSATLHSCVTDAPPYLIRQEVVMPDGSRNEVLSLMDAD